MSKHTFECDLSLAAFVVYNTEHGERTVYEPRGCDCEVDEEQEPELTTAQELGAGSYLGYGNNLP